MHDDDLTDVPVPDDALREAVNRRAAALRWHRRALLGGSALASSLTLVLVLTTFLGGPRAGALDVVDAPTPTATPTVEQQPTPSAPSETPSPTAAPETPTPSTHPSPTPTCVEPEPGFTHGCPDGKPGWGVAYAGCEPAPAPTGARTARLLDGVTVTYVLPDHVAQGQRAQGVLRFVSTRSDTVVLTVDFHEPSEAWVRGAGEAGALHWTDMMGGPEIQLSPHDPVDEEPLSAGSRACGDTQADPEPALPRGAYEAGATLAFRAVTQAPASAAPRPTSDPSPEQTLVPTLGPSATPSPTSSPSPGPSYAPLSEQGTFSVRVPLQID